MEFIHTLATSIITTRFSKFSDTAHLLSEPSQAKDEVMYYSCRSRDVKFFGALKSAIFLPNLHELESLPIGETRRASQVLPASGDRQCGRNHG